MEHRLRAILLERGRDWIGIDINSDWIQFQPTRKDVRGDLTLMVFPFAKALQCPPAVAATKLGEAYSTMTLGLEFGLEKPK